MMLKNEERGKFVNNNKLERRNKMGKAGSFFGNKRKQRLVYESSEQLKDSKEHKKQVCDYQETFHLDPQTEFLPIPL